MENRDTVDRTIRNQRRRGWHILLWLGGWSLAWMGGAIAVERWLTSPISSNYFRVIVWICWLVPMLATFFVIIVRIGRLPPKRLKLGEDLWAVPGPSVPVKDVRGFHFDRDPDEDYVEAGFPIPCCQLTIELRKKKLRMIISLGDASRVSEWAAHHGVPVFDPQGYASRIHVPETRQ